ncbi:MAG: hypothetical protein JSV85_06980 [Candidatus Bathyarchaeota archaeon]|nr:MAG: hypothetical protein JSV85_06980 [Candidatus Bathyarchaeota archaeon]
MKTKKLLFLCIFISVAIGLLASSQQAHAGTDRPGTGILYVYVDTWGGTEAPANSHGTYDVNIGLTYYIRVWDLKEFNPGTLLTIKIGWTDVTKASRTDFFHDVEVKEDSGVRYVDVAWTVPLEAMISTTGTVHYKRDNPSTPDYIARGQLSNVGHMHFIPETALGTIGPMLALIAGLGFLAIRKHER